MATISVKAKPYKLKPTDSDNITRDDVLSWSYTLLSCARQCKEWKQFLPGNSKATWTAKSENPTHGWEVTKQDETTGDEVPDDEATDELKSNFQDFLTFVASHCPSGFMNQVMRELTSFDWVLEQLYSTYGLDTKGENFLAGNDIKFEFSSTFTYAQALMLMKDFYVNCLLPKGSYFKGKKLNRDEELTPLAENFIIEKCLAKIDIRLPEHIRNTRGHLFNEERPTLACNQNILLAQIDTMMAEIEGKEQNISVGQVRAPRSQFRPRFRQPGPQRFWNQTIRRQIPRPFQPPFRAPATFRNAAARPRYNGGNRQSTPGCIRCLEAKRTDASRFHSLRDCPYPRTSANTGGMKVFLVQDPNFVEQNEENDTYAAEGGEDGVSCDCV